MFDPFSPMNFRIVATVFMLIAIAMASMALYDINNPPDSRRRKRSLYGYTSSHYSSTTDYGSDSVKSPFALIITFNVIFLLVAAAWIYLKRKQIEEKKTNVPIVRPPSVAVALDGLGFLLLMIMGIVAARGKFIKDICDTSPPGYGRTCGAAKAAAAFTFLASITLLVCLMHSIADMRMETSNKRDSASSDDAEEEGGEGHVHHHHATAIMADESQTPSMETNYIQHTDDAKAFAMPLPQQQQQMDMQEFMKMQQQFQQFQMQQQQQMMMQQQMMQQPPQQLYPGVVAGGGFVVDQQQQEVQQEEQEQTLSPPPPPQAVAEKTEQ